MMIGVTNGIGIGLQEFVPGGGAAWVYDAWHSSYLDGNVEDDPSWTKITGALALRHVGPGSMYAQNIGDDALVVWTVPITLEDDHFIQCTLVDTWGIGTGDWVGIAVRASNSACSCYMLRFGYCSVYGWDLVRYAAGTPTVLASAEVAPATGDVYELRAVGTTIGAYKDGEQLASVTDATYATGSVGVGVDGSDANAEIHKITAGNLPKAGNAYKFNDRLARSVVAATHIDSACFATNPQNAGDGNTSTAGSHIVALHDVGGTNMHWVNFDLGAPFETTGVELYDNGSYHDEAHWDDVSFFGRNDPDDAWTLIKAHMDLSNANNFGWLGPGQWDAPVTYRYYRAEIYSTLDTNGPDGAAAYEVAFWGNALT